jgi:hypothetical protein
MPYIEKIDIGDDWIPETGIEYLIEYNFYRKEPKTVFIIGKFSKTRENFYHFHWIWSASSLQLKVGSNDWKSCVNVWKFHRGSKDFISEKEFEI